MKRTIKSLTVLALSAMAASGVLAQDPAPATEGTSDVREIEVTAKKYEFNPNVITIKQGDHVKLVITALDRDHGFKLEPFSIDLKLKKGKPTTVQFIADRAGSFPFQCSDFCGLGHGNMKGKLVVERASSPSADASRNPQTTQEQ
jgi:cytochrome c oxidase subunit 2